ncbi:hypothetical protein DUI87_04314 [Hirundo rustica rustica]|uniref:Uncharacterized protein n=1 Tax=Hirundo rustica rustica TaxID=333673 RepID=A0A3M0LH73_HIRRU|nr:hypothetical protein DUI87_04314 [Hirundo rustica rustica]
MKGASFTGDVGLGNGLLNLPVWSPRSVPCVIGSCGVNDEHGHRQSAGLEGTKFLCGSKTVALILLGMQRSGLDECMRVNLLLDIALSPADSWVYRVSPALQFRAEPGTTRASSICAMAVEGRVCGSALVLIAESPEA